MNIKASELKELAGGAGFRNCSPLEVGDFTFFVYADEDVNAPFGKGKLLVHLCEADSPFENTIDFTKQSVDTDGMKRHIIKELKKIKNQIEKLLKQEV
ncbi:MAG: hypothetical protein A3F91_09835 [Flavobacteria bacterium RIFCSPLOWO2_12_FULL_35_11]|nr:MAG: hypothetical protein A3F91_09835 [Flavobacteria bacterium RIFCSPLOWO2_12_FULL_35_11]